MTDPVLRGIGEAYGKSAAQVMLRWHVQQGRSAIPKSVRAERIAENFNVFDFELTTAELAQIDALDTCVRGGQEPDSITLETSAGPFPRLVKEDRQSPVCLRMDAQLSENPGGHLSPMTPSGTSCIIQHSMALPICSYRGTIAPTMKVRGCGISVPFCRTTAE